jgi:ABC-type Zn uptake system ZnuABC Zn-binding protein ZnuA
VKDKRTILPLLFLLSLLLAACGTLEVGVEKTATPAPAATATATTRPTEHATQAVTPETPTITPLPPTATATPTVEEPKSPL